MTVRWIGQSGYVIQTQSTQIIIDPYLSDAVNRVVGRPRLVASPTNPPEIKADAIICTHDHLDHLDVDAIAQMDKALLFITTAEGKAKLNTMGFENVQALSPGESTAVGDVEITAVFASHTVEAFGVILKAEDKTLYFSGDTLFDQRLFEIEKFRPDIAFLCINGRLGNMNGSEAAIAARKIGAKLNIPNHYGMFASNTADPHTFTERIDNGFIMEFNKEYQVQRNKLHLTGENTVEIVI